MAPLAFTAKQSITGSGLFWRLSPYFQDKRFNLRHRCVTRLFDEKSTTTHRNSTRIQGRFGDGRIRRDRYRLIVLSQTLYELDLLLSDGGVPSK